MRVDHLRPPKSLRSLKNFDMRIVKIIFTLLRAVKLLE